MQKHKRRSLYDGQQSWLWSQQITEDFFQILILPHAFQQALAKISYDFSPNSVSLLLLITLVEHRGKQWWAHQPPVPEMNPEAPQLPLFHQSNAQFIKSAYPTPIETGSSLMGFTFIFHLKDALLTWKISKTLDICTANLHNEINRIDSDQIGAWWPLHSCHTNHVVSEFDFLNKWQTSMRIKCTEFHLSLHEDQLIIRKL